MTRTTADLRALPHETKIEWAREKIREAQDRCWLLGLDLCVSVAGKDSRALLHLVRSLYPETKACFVDTGLEYPEVRALARATPNCDIIKPKMRFPDVVAKYGWPVTTKKQAKYVRELQTSKSAYLILVRRTGFTKAGSFLSMRQCSAKWIRLFVDTEKPIAISEKCCEVMKKDPIHRYSKNKYLQVIGVMTDNSKQREHSWVTYGCNAFDQKNPTSRPLMIWTEQDVLRYIRDNEVEIPSVYGEIIGEYGTLATTGCTNTGCVFCGFGVHLERGLNRFQRLADTHPKLWKYVLFRLGMAKVLDHMGVNYYPEWLS